jgi:putative FmdB family regulatory protein
MPFYEYQCSSCSHHVEVLQKISDAPLRKCPDCGKQALKRLISAPVFRLKGGGWYETDFKSDGEQKRNLAGREEGGESKPEETKSDAKADAKTDAKSDAKPAETKSETATSESGGGKKSSAAKPAAKPSKAVKPAKAVKSAVRKKKAAKR